MKNRFASLSLLLMLCLTLLSGCVVMYEEPEATVLSLDDIPAYDGTPYVAVNGNVPFFTEEEITTDVFETFADLDYLNRCGVTYANVCRELMPTEKRGDIGHIRPTGWVTAKYDFVDGKYLYNRCHLLGFQLTGENDNERNLITGTRYFNVDGMLPFENLVADYVKETDNHVLYRVTPIFEGEELVARGALMEGYSVEDRGEGVTFCVYAYNVQPGVEIDYATGESWLAETDPDATPSSVTYIGNTNSKKFHLPSCASLPSEQNRTTFDSRDAAVKAGYTPCGGCKP